MTWRRYLGAALGVLFGLAIAPTESRAVYLAAFWGVLGFVVGRWRDNRRRAS